MDSFTQIILGAAVAEVFLGKKLGNRAAIYGAIIGTIPDLDILFGRFYDPISAIEMHRGFSHSILFFALLAPLLGFLIKKIEKKSGVTVSKAMLAAFLCLFTHAILDAFTTWGTQLFWPHSYRVAIRSISVIDPLYTLPFLICLILAMRLPKESSRRQMWNTIGLTISTFYLFLTVFVQQITTNKFQEALAQNDIVHERLAVKPTFFNIILWNATVETQTGYWLGDYSYFDSQPISFRFYSKQHDLISPLKADPTASKLVKISEGWYTISTHNGKMYFNDLRFGLLNSDHFAFSYEIKIDDKKVSVYEVNNKGNREGIKMMKNLASRIAGN